MSDTIVIPVLILALVAAIWAGGAWGRARSSRAHADVQRTGRGSWHGVIRRDDVPFFLPTVRIGFLKSLLMNASCHVRLDLGPDGLRLSTTSWLARSRPDQSWSAPWSEVVSAERAPAGFTSFGGTFSLVRLTDVLVTTTGASAQAFLDAWDLTPDPDEQSPSAEDVADEQEWEHYVREELGEQWQPGTALLRIRTSAPDGLVEAISRWASGSLHGPPPRASP